MPVGYRLTDLERDERALSERAFQGQVTGLATMLGWSWAHWRPLQNRRGQWRTPVEGSLGQGWPDLTLLRVRDRRLIFAELKRELESPSAPQAAVLAALGELQPRWDDFDPDPGSHGIGGTRIEVHLWRPSDLCDPIEDSVIGRILR